MKNAPDDKESPDYLRTSLAAAMTLGFKNGRFYRKARLHCINLLLVYSRGCTASCAYCGLSGKRPGVYREKSFIRVDWPVYELEDIIKSMEEMEERKNGTKRICISMVTRKRAPQDTTEIIKRIREKLDTPISVLMAPTVSSDSDLLNWKEGGADKIGVAIDAATPELFDKYRGKGVKGPHQWETYWNTYQKSLEIFGRDNSGIHLMVGLGETERETAAIIQRSRDMGGNTHLFSFYPEAGSILTSCSPPPIDQYRRIQLARYLIDEDIAGADDFTFDSEDRIVGFGISLDKLQKVMDSGQPFMTSGCPGRDGKVACNRPYANFPPPKIRNFPFNLNTEDLALVKSQLNIDLSMS